MPAGDLTPEQLRVLACQLGCMWPWDVPEELRVYAPNQSPPPADPTFDPLSDPYDEPFPEEYR